MSNFGFIEKEFPRIAVPAKRLEKFAMEDPRVACFYARRSVEKLVEWLYQQENLPKHLKKLGAMINEEGFKKKMPEPVFIKLDYVRRFGNQAVHSDKKIYQYDALKVSEQLFHCCLWLFSEYSKSGADGITDKEFNKELLTRPRAPGAIELLACAAAEDDVVGIYSLKSSLEDDSSEEVLSNESNNFEEIRKEWEKEDEEEEKQFNQEESEKLRQEFREAKKQNRKNPVRINYSEKETRELFIDLLLREAGWDPDFEEGRLKTKEYEVKGMPNTKGKGFVDYVLWSQAGKPLAVIEAKRSSKDPRIGRNQAKLYADCLEEEEGQRPVIFYTNGYEHWIWDDARYPERRIQGFLKEDELELMIQRRRIATNPDKIPVNRDIVDRYYHEQAIRNVTGAFTDGRRKALIVMATGSGKTRNAVALTDILMRANMVKRVLFLADRVSLVSQAARAFAKCLPNSAPVNLCLEKEKTDSRILFSTYQSMIGFIDESMDSSGDRRKRFGNGHFDLIFIDEAHRSVYRRYRSIFEYFDSLLVGLTATPRSEVDRDTYSLFDLNPGVPTYHYELDKAIEDNHLVPPKLVSVPLKFEREGIKYKELSKEEKEQWDLIEWNDDGTTPDEVDSAALNEWLFNKDTLDKVLAHVMKEGLRIEAGQSIGKTIIFAKNKKHANFIQERFDANYPHLKGSFASVIHNEVTYAHKTIEDFSTPLKPPPGTPRIVISVDMLDTGIDIPDLVNLVFFKKVRSRTKFWQMIGRGTRKCSDLFGEGKDKDCFFVFDYCGNFQYFDENPEGVEGNVQDSISSKIFRLRLDLLQSIREVPEQDEKTVSELVDQLHGEVNSMNVDNFIVRPMKREVERFKGRDSWEEISKEDQEVLSEKVAVLPTSMEPEHPSAKSFDVLILRTQLAVLNKEPSFKKLTSKISVLAGKLLEVEIPEVAEVAETLEEIQEDSYWEGITVPELELLRKRLRDIMRHVPKGSRNIIETDFEDHIGEGVEVKLGNISDAVDRAAYKKRFTDFLEKNKDHITIKKLKLNESLTDTDLQELERILFEEGGPGSRDEFEACYGDQKSLGVFIRELVGLDRAAAKEAFSYYLDGTTFNAKQMEFIEMVIDHLTDNGIMDPAILFEHPFTNLSPDGPISLFNDDEAGKIVSLIRSINDNAATG